MKYQVYIRPDADKDIDLSSHWYEQQQKGLGHEFLNEVVVTLDKISETPEIFPLVFRGARRALIKRFPFGIYYLIFEQKIIIIAVMHGSRKPAEWKKRVR